MRFYKEQVRVGDVREVKKFAILPIQIRHETRWLENVTYLEEYVNVWGHEDEDENSIELIGIGMWKPFKFVDKKVQ